MIINESLSNTFFGKSNVDDDINNEGFKTINKERQVVIACKPKKLVVNAPLSDDLSTNITNQWSDYFSGGVIGTSFNLIESFNKATTSWNGTSIHQPYMSRKVWSGTNPLSFDLKFNFIATVDAKTEVFDPICKLAAMATASESNLTEKEQTLLDEVNQIMSEKDESSRIAKVLAKGIHFITELNDLISKKWDVPGPAIIPSNDNESQCSMPITIYLPAFNVLTNCYIESLSINLSKSVDINGYPLGANVGVKVTRMDATTSYRSKDDTYRVNWNYNYENDSLKQISSWVNKIGSVVHNFFDAYDEAAKNILDMTK